MVMGEINFWSVLISGLIAGYVMAFVGYWMEGVFGLPRYDVTLGGTVFLGQDKPGRWTLGFLVHEMDAVIFAIIYAGFLYDILPGADYLKGVNINTTNTYNNTTMGYGNNKSNNWTW